MIELCAGVLGRTIVSVDGDPPIVSWPRPSARRLVTLLLLSHDRRLPREALAEQLFPHLEPRSAARSLSKALSMARSRLDTGSRATLLSADRSCIGFASDVAVSLDVEGHLTQLRSAMACAAPAVRAEQLRAAVDDERPVLVEDADQAWAQEFREHVERVRRAARLELARTTDGLLDWQRVLVHEPANECACEQVVTAHLAAGRRREALDVLDRCLRATADLGLQPGWRLANLRSSLVAAQAEPVTSGASSPREDRPRVPSVRYVRTRGAHVAYMTAGSGPPTLLFLLEWIGNLDVQWRHPVIGRFLYRLADQLELLTMDKRGTGLSDPILGALPTPDELGQDVLAVLDADGADRAVLGAIGGSGPMALSLAARRPDRVRALILVNAFARLSWAPDHPWGIPPAVQRRVIDEAVAGWGQGVHIAGSIAPSAVGDPVWNPFFAQLQRSSASPGTAGNLFRMAYEADARPVLSRIDVPTLIIHIDGDPYVRVQHGRDLARRIRGSRYVELLGEAHMPWVHHGDQVLAHISDFVADLAGTGLGSPTPDAGRR